MTVIVAEALKAIGEAQIQAREELSSAGTEDEAEEGARRALVISVNAYCDRLEKLVNDLRVVEEARIRRLVLHLRPLLSEHLDFTSVMRELKVRFPSFGPVLDRLLASGASLERTVERMECVLDEVQERAPGRGSKLVVRLSGMNRERDLDVNVEPWNAPPESE
ncbi:MAG: hypothetical protein ACYC8T_32085 [Myxococcaceae bacterium]